MKHQKYTYRLLVVTLVVLAFSFVSIGSLAHAEAPSATGAATDPSADSTNPVADSTVDALAAQAALAGVGVRVVNRVKVFHTGDGVDLEMVKLCNGGDAVKDQGGELVSLQSALQSQLHLPISTEISRNIPARFTLTGTPAEISPACYSQHDTQWSRILIGTTSSIPSTQDPSLPSSGNTMWRKGCFITSTAMEPGTYHVSLADYNYTNHRLTGTTSIANPKHMNYWLIPNGGLNATGSMYFEAMANLPGIYGLWQSKYHWTGSYADIYVSARDMVAGTFSSFARPSLPIMLMNKTGIPEHYCAWYKSDGSTSGSNNSIVQPTRTECSDGSLKCTIAASGYSPENDQYLMRIACWRK